MYSFVVANALTGNTHIARTSTSSADISLFFILMFSLHCIFCVGCWILFPASGGRSSPSESQLSFLYFALTVGFFTAESHFTTRQEHTLQRQADRASTANGVCTDHYAVAASITITNAATNTFHLCLFRSLTVSRFSSVSTGMHTAMQTSPTVRGADI